MGFEFFSLKNELVRGDAKANAVGGSSCMSKHGSLWRRIALAIIGYAMRVVPPDRSSWARTRNYFGKNATLESACEVFARTR
jgi:hypothetical protein